MEPSDRFTLEWADDYTIHSYELDAEGRTTLAALCRFMQESAWRHAEHLEMGYSRFLEKNLVWILSRQRIQIELYPRWGDTVTVRTRPTGKDRLFCYRDFILSDSSDRIIGRAATMWFAIALTTRAPQRTDVYFHVPIPDDGTLPSPTRLRKLSPLNTYKHKKTVQVAYSDLDTNHHVNNVRYVDWIFDSFADDFLKTHTLKELEINYLSESLCRDEIMVCAQENGTTFHHRLVRRSDDAELMRARSSWHIREKPVPS
jgi:medium-chain acyl-[acyl-carrier-protein] hydrolase